MKVLSVLTYYHPHWTGLTAHAQRLAEGLARRGHTVTVLTHRHAPTLPARAVHNGVAIERVRPLARISRGMIAPAFPVAAARLLRDHDVVLINSPMFESLPIALAARALGRPSVLVHHGDLIMPSGIGNRIVEHVTVASMVAAARLADCVTTYSDDYGEHSDFLLPFRPKLTAIAPPVDIPVPDRAAAVAWRRELGLADKRVIGFAGRFVEEKGVDILLRALPELLAVDPNVHLVFAAETDVVYERLYDRCRPLMAPLSRSISELGLLRDRARLAQFYALCDVLALPSRSDCFALVQAEAMLCGTPVVATDIPGAREAVRRTGMGRLVAPEDPHALAAGLDAVLRERQRYVRSRDDIAAVFDSERVIDAYEAVLDALHTRRAVSGRRGAQSVPVSTRVNAIAPAFPARESAILDRVLRNEMDMAYRRRMPILLDYLDLRDGDRVLDGGCGMGFGLLIMGALRTLTLTGVDRDRQRLALARQEGVPGAMMEAEVAHLPFANASFDKVLLAEVLEHVADDRAALREVYRVLGAGGRLAISVPHADFPLAWDPINRLWNAIGGRPLRNGPLVGIWSLHRRLYWPDDLASRVSEAGFVVEQVETATHYSVPFAHFLVYGIGRPLIERDLLPARWRASADRMRGSANPGGRLNPINLARSLLAAVDRLNERPAVARKRTFVNVLLKARKP